MLACHLETWSNVEAYIVIQFLHVKGVTLVNIYCCLMSMHVIKISAPDPHCFCDITSAPYTCSMWQWIVFHANDFSRQNKCMKLNSVIQELVLGSAPSFFCNQVDYRKEFVCLVLENMTYDHKAHHAGLSSLQHRNTIISSSKEIQSSATIKEHHGNCLLTPWRWAFKGYLWL